MLEKTFKIKSKFQLDLPSPMRKPCPLEPLWRKEADHSLIRQIVHEEELMLAWEYK